MLETQDKSVLVIIYLSGHTEYIPKDERALDYIIANMQEIDDIMIVGPAPAPETAPAPSMELETITAFDNLLSETN